MCIYIVDDEELACRGLAYMVNCIFSNSPQEIHCFTSPAEALSKMEAYPPDIILLDMIMEDMNGLEFISKIDKKFSPKIVIISGNDTYNFIRESFKLSVEDYLLKPIEFSELEAVMLKLHKSNEAPKTDEISDVTGASWSFVAIVKAPCDTELSDRIIGIPKLCNPKSNVSALTYTEAYGESVFIFSMNAKEYYEECKNAFVHIFNTFTSDNSTIYKAAFSDCVRQDAISNAITQAKELLKYRIYDEFSFCYGPQNQLELAEPEDEDYRADLTRMTPFLSSEDKESYSRFINTWFSREALSAIHYDTIKSRYSLFEDKLFRVINNDSKSMQIKNFDEFYTLDEIIKYINCMLSAVLEVLNKNRFEVNIISEAFEYINNNYNKDINLSFMSNKFNLSYSYFSRIFKMYAGVSFTQYILKVRMEKAKELLVMSPNLKIKEVALMVGYDYDNVQNFTRAFKKYFGRSPQYYKK